MVGRSKWLCPLLLAASVLWLYRTTVGDLVSRWSHDPEYSHGYLVVGCSVACLWARRRRLRNVGMQSSWWGVPLVLVGGVMRLAGLYVNLDWLDAFSLLPCLGGCCLLVGGASALWWAWPAITFLLFMIPLPYRVEILLAHPLQALTSNGAAYLLQTAGYPAVTQGNMILLGEQTIAVAQACNGLGMLIAFFALSTVVAWTVRRSFAEQALLLLSAIPIALAANIVRVTLTAMLVESVGPRFGQRLFHGWGGWLMMPLALAMLWVEARILARVVVEERWPRGAVGEA